MSTDIQESPTLGSCPNCRTEIASFDVLIEYETSAGRPEVWAECPSCREVVHPD